MPKLQQERPPQDKTCVFWLRQPTRALGQMGWWTASTYGPKLTILLQELVSLEEGVGLDLLTLPPNASVFSYDLRCNFYVSKHPTRVSHHNHRWFLPETRLRFPTLENSTFGNWNCHAPSPVFANLDSLLFCSTPQDRPLGKSVPQDPLVRVPQVMYWWWNWHFDPWCRRNSWYGRWTAFVKAVNSEGLENGLHSLYLICCFHGHVTIRIGNGRIETALVIC